MQPKDYKHVTDHITKVKCNAATCLIRPQHVGHKPDRIRQVSLYMDAHLHSYKMNHYNQYITSVSHYVLQ